MISVVTEKAESVHKALYLTVSDNSTINYGEYVLAILAKIFNVNYDPANKNGTLQSVIKAIVAKEGKQLDDLVKDFFE